MPITNDDLAKQRAAFWSETFDLILRVSSDLECGRFDGAERAEAETFLAESESFYRQLLIA